MVDLLNALKLSCKKESTTSALKRRLFGLTLANDKPQGNLKCRDKEKNKNSTNFCSFFCSFFSLPHRGSFGHRLPGATNFWNKANHKSRKSFYLKIKMTRIKPLNFWQRPFMCLVFFRFCLAEKKHQIR